MSVIAKSHSQFDDYILILMKVLATLYYIKFREQDVLAMDVWKFYDVTLKDTKNLILSITRLVQHYVM